MRSCTRCDQANPDDAQFCTRCGMPLTLAAPPDAPLPATQAHRPIAASAPPVAPQPIQVNVTVAPPTTAPTAPPPVVVVTQQTSGPGCLVRGIYFLFIGVWLGLLWTGAAWLLLITVLGLPLGLLMLNRLPQVMTLKPMRTQTQVTMQGGTVLVSQGALAQRAFWLRALYFVAVGWWLSGLWLSLAWGLVGVTFGLGLPLAFWMFDRTPAIVTLARR